MIRQSRLIEALRRSSNTQIDILVQMYGELKLNSVSLSPF